MKAGFGIRDWRFGQAGLLKPRAHHASSRGRHSRLSESRIPNPESRPHGFSLLELLVALAIFATMAALAYGGLDSVVRTRADLEARQAQFQALRRSVNLLERDLRQCAPRPVRDNGGAALPAFVGAADRVELTRLGFANPQAEARSNLERVGYAFADGALVRAAWPVLDRAPGTKPSTLVLRRPIAGLQLRYLDAGNRWSDAWPPPTSASDAPPPPLPRAVEFRIATGDYGEISRIVELPAPWPDTAVEAGGPVP